MRNKNIPKGCLTVTGGTERLVAVVYTNLILLPYTFLDSGAVLSFDREDKLMESPVIEFCCRSQKWVV